MGEIPPSPNRKFNPNPNFNPITLIGKYDQQGVKIEKSNKKKGKLQLGIFP